MMRRLRMPERLLRLRRKRHLLLLSLVSLGIKLDEVKFVEDCAEQACWAWLCIIYTTRTIL
jgi:hypothetical protein